MFNSKILNTTLIFIFMLLLLINIRELKAIDFEEDEEGINQNGKILKGQASVGNNNNANDNKQLANSRFSLNGQAPSPPQLSRPSFQQSMASASANAQASAASGTQNLRGPINKNSNDNNNKELDLVDENANRNPRTRKPKKKTFRGSGQQGMKKLNRDRTQLSRDRYYEEEDDYDCYDDYVENNQNNNKFYKMATQPMRQFGRIMNKMFDQISPSDDDSDDYGDFSPQPSGVSISSSFSGGNDYSSIMSALTNRNGRTSGIVAETRNGRTKTRRIGSQGAGEDNEDEEEGEYM